MLKIAVTGGAGSGKSTVAAMFRDLGAVVLDADAVAREAAAVGTPAWQELRQAFGPEFFNEDGALNRAKMGQQVFNDAAARQRLEAILHPRIIQEIQGRLQALEARGAALVMVEVPLLFEKGLAPSYDRVIVVYTDRDTQIKRLRDRDDRPAGEIEGLLAAQWPLQDKAALAHYVVDNGGSPAETRRQVRKIWDELKKGLDTNPRKG